MRGARINVMNRGDDTPLHLAASHGHRDIVAKVKSTQQTDSGTSFCTFHHHVFTTAMCFLPHADHKIILVTNNRRLSTTGK